MSLRCKFGFHDWEILDFCKIYTHWKQKVCLRCGKFHDGKAIYYQEINLEKEKARIRAEAARQIVSESYCVESNEKKEEKKEKPKCNCKRCKEKAASKLNECKDK